MSRTDIKSLSFEALRAFLAEAGAKPFRAAQLYQWMHEKCAASFDEMTNLPGSMRDMLKRETVLTVLEPVQVLTSAVDGTQKFLFSLADGNVIESVLMKYHHGNSVCISSQVGCRMGCRFCASTLDGRVRDLTAAEMLDQVYRIQSLCGERISNVVVMGSGEPLDNYDNLLAFIRMLSDEHGLHISQRSITVSTCGLVPQMRQLAREKLAVTLALSLHASSQEKRLALMPIAGKYGLDEVIDACRDYFEQTGRRMTFEYALVSGVNDTDRDAQELSELLKDLHGHVNLIPVNPVAERSFTAPDRQSVLRFQKKLENYGINVTIRREMGRDINGACGQLRRSYTGRETAHVSGGRNPE